MPYFIGMNSEVRYFLKLRCCIRVRNRPVKPYHKNLSRFTDQKARPTGASECGPDQKSYLISGMGILPMLNNGAISQLELRYCTILNKLCMNRQDACSTRKFTLCGTGILPVPENGARYQLEGIFYRIFLENGLSGDRLNC
jgi:hypothetical protein